MGYLKSVLSEEWQGVRTVHTSTLLWDLKTWKTRERINEKGVDVGTEKTVEEDQTRHKDTEWEMEVHEGEDDGEI